MQYAPKEEIDARIAKVKVLMKKASLDGAFFHYKIDYYYLSGTMQDSLLFVSADDEPVLFVKREISRARRESPIGQILPMRSVKEIPGHLKPMKKIGMQLDVVPYNDVIKISGAFRRCGIHQCIPADQRGPEIQIALRDSTDGKGCGDTEEGLCPGA